MDGWMDGFMRFNLTKTNQLLCGAGIIDKQPQSSFTFLLILDQVFTPQSCFSRYQVFSVCNCQNRKTNIDPPTTSLNTEHPTWRDVQEVVKHARSSSAPGSSGIPYKVYKKMPYAPSNVVEANAGKLI